MKTILVTGANGQLGSEVRRLSEKYEESCQFLFTDVAELDITDRSAVLTYMEQHAVDYVVNCAAYTAVDKAESDEVRAELLNSVAPGYLAEAVAEVGGTMIHISTDYVFDGTACRPYREDDTPCPQTVYGRTKLSGEEAVVRGCPGAMVIRTGWLYSAFGNNFVKTMMRLGRERDELGVVADQVGTPTYAADLAQTILTAIEQGVRPGLYHYAGLGTCSWYDFTLAIHRAAGITGCHVRPLHTEEYPAPAKRPHYSVLDKSKIQATYHIEIPWWEESLQACVERLS